MMPDYYEELTGLLDGTKLGIPRERLDWAGFEAAMALYREAPEPTKKEIAGGITQIISRNSNGSDWELLADAIYLSYILGIAEAKEAITAIDLTKVGEEWRLTVGPQKEVYLASLSGNSNT